MRGRRAQYVVLDLETVTDSKLPPPKPGPDGAPIFPAAPWHEIVVMGAALLDPGCRVRRIWCVAEGQGEAMALSALTTFLAREHDAGRPVTLVSWNGRGFDLPVIAARCLRHGIAFPWYYTGRDARYRYSTDGHFDLLDYLADHGAGKRFGLDVAARLIGLPGKLDTKGADVAAMVSAGEIEAVRAYCMQDVAQTVALLLRVQLLRGVLDAASCAHTLRSLLAVIAGEPRLSPMLPFIDRARLLPAQDEPTRGAA
jgi:predicted PolB exonuclease-like 3'-5' exonuclease